MRMLSVSRIALGLLLMTAFLGTASRAADDERPVVDDSKTAPQKIDNTKLPTLFLVGDSTLNSGPTAANPLPLRGWAQEIGVYFDRSKINVINRAIGGRSSRTFQNEGRWDKVLAEMKAGDFVIVQFGHNDAGRYDDPAAKGRPSLRGEGDDTADVTKTDGSKETIHTFGWYMRKYVTDAKAKGAGVILCSMVPHKDWKQGKIVRNERETFVKWTANAARETGGQFIDLNEIVAEGYEKLGEEKVAGFFADKRTHTSVEGAKYTAAAVVSGLKSLHPDPLASFYSKMAEGVTPAGQNHLTAVGDKSTFNR